MIREKEVLSRRALIIRASKCAVGAAVGTTIISVHEPTQKAFGSGEPAKMAYPWPYKKLNLEEVGKIAYENWYKDYCSYAVASGILIPLQNKVGEPYTSFPIISTRWGHAGAVGWGTLCGSLTGVGIATGLIAGKEGEKILNDVMSWYSQAELPIYEPGSPKSSIKNRNKSGSPICHISSGKWMKKEGVKFFTPERRERCARLSADVAMHTVKLLNAWADGKYKPVHGSQARMHDMPSQNNCSSCHSEGASKV